MEEMYPAVAVPFRVGNSVCENPAIDTHIDITRLLMADAARLLSDSVTNVSTVVDKDCICGDLDDEVGETLVPVPKVDKGGGVPLLDMVPEKESNWVVSDYVLTRESEEDDSLSFEGDQVLDSSCSLSVASETSSLCGEDFLSFEATSELGTPNSVDIDKSISAVDLIAKAADFSQSNAEKEVGGNSVATVVSVEEDVKTSAVVLQLALERGVSGTVTRSVFEVEYTPLWGFTSMCGRRPEMEDAVATVPQFVKIPIQLLIGDRVLDGMSNLNNQTGHFFGVYDGHGGSQVANYCRERLHSALAEEIELVKNGLRDGVAGDSCHEQWKKAFTNCFLKIDTEVGGKGGAEPVAPETVGSTAVVAIICSSHIIVANCGNSRAVLCRGKDPMALSVDHKPNREDEYARIEAAGGKVIQWNGHRVFGVLAIGSVDVIS